MPWSKTTFVENVTKVVAAVMANIETGIEELKTAVALRTTRAEAETIASEAAAKVAGEAAVVVSTSNLAITGIPAAVDGVTLVAGQAILLTGQTNKVQNGLWVVGAGAWTRPAGFANGSEQFGVFVPILEGVTGAGSIWLLTNKTRITVGTSEQTWLVNFPGSGVVAGNSTYEGFGLASAGVYKQPPGSWRPYSSESVFNRAMARPTAEHPKSALYVEKLLTYNSGKPRNITIGEKGTAETFAHPVYYPKTTDPAYTIKQSGSHTPIADVVNLPAGAKAEPGSDHHLAIVMPNGTEYDCWNVVSITPGSPGVIQCTNAGRSSITDKGYGVNIATAANFSLLQGIIRIAEWEQAVAGPKGSSLSHALFFVLPEVSGTTDYGQGVALEGGNGAYVFPANHAANVGSVKLKANTTSGTKTLTLPVASKRLGVGTKVTGTGIAAGTTITAVISTTEYTLSANATATGELELTFTGLADVLPTGAFLVLDYTDAEIEALELKKWEEVIALTLAREGAYVGDTSGASGIGFMAESHVSYTALGITDPAIAFGIANAFFHNQETEEAPGVFHFDDYAGIFSSGGGGAKSKKIDWTRLLVLVPPAP